MSQNHPQSHEIDELLHVLADPYCRTTLSYLQDSSDNVISIQDLTNELSTEAPGGTTQLSIKLHHSTLPRLAATGVLEYDPPDRTVRYQGHPELETLLDTISECALKPSD